MHFGRPEIFAAHPDSLRYSADREFQAPFPQTAADIRYIHDKGYEPPSPAVYVPL